MQKVDDRRIQQTGRTLAGLLAPLAIVLTALAIHQSELVHISWVPGTVVVVLVAGLACGWLIRSPWAAAYILVLWAGWAVVAVVTDSGGSDSPVGAMVLVMLPLLALPAAFAALIGALISSAWSSRRERS